MLANVASNALKSKQSYDFSHQEMLVRESVMVVEITYLFFFFFFFEETR